MAGGSSLSAVVRSLLAVSRALLLKSEGLF